MIDLNEIKKTLDDDLELFRRIYIDTHGLVVYAMSKEVSEKYKGCTIEEVFNLYNNIVPDDYDSELLKMAMYDHLDNMYNRIIRRTTNDENRNSK